ncbi:hypothetical protein DSO57_1005261 [Entomophthora muscae]|uniref:Uncharacterized protein n=1 Tax=Entomophthora muscae TaxID=34485 RepID=A0ACC2SXB9_9FUNG|nr:hypothetical protein DSO57_1005261 [Entomophthora muscae]
MAAADENVLITANTEAVAYQPLFLDSPNLGESEIYKNRFGGKGFLPLEASVARLASGGNQAEAKGMRKNFELIEASAPTARSETNTTSMVWEGNEWLPYYKAV